jgi:hypothetical protein
MKVVIVNGLGLNGVYNQNTGTIEINGELSDIQRLKTLLHEIQHVIQDIEGFARGGNIQSAFPVDGKSSAWGMLKQERRKMVTPISLAEYTKNAGWDSEQEARADYEKYVADHKKWFSKGIPRDLDIELQKSVAEKYYRSQGGEVEARNVQTRMGFTPEQRRATLLAETEDVALEDQIFIGDALDRAASLPDGGENADNGSMETNTPSPEEIQEMKDRISNWSSQETIKKAQELIEGKTKDEARKAIFEHFDNELKPIAYVPEQ